MHETEPDQAVERKAPLKTPPVSDAVRWREADQAVSMAVSAALHSTFDSIDIYDLVNTYENVTHAELLNLFGTHTEKLSKPARNNRDEPSKKEKQIKKEM